MHLRRSSAGVYPGRQTQAPPSHLLLGTTRQSVCMLHKSPTNAGGARTVAGVGRYPAEQRYNFKIIKTYQ